MIDFTIVIPCFNEEKNISNLLEEINIYLKDYKYWAPVARVDNVYGDRNLVCSCPSLDEYKDEAA